MFEGTLLNLIIEANSVVPDRTDPKHGHPCPK